MKRTNKTHKLRDLFYSTDFIPKSENNNILFHNKDNIIPKNVFPPLLKSYEKKFYYSKYNNIFSKENIKNKEINKINKTFYSIKRAVHQLMPRTKSLVYKCDKNKFKNIGYKNIFHSDTFENIRNKIYYNEFNEEFNEEKKNYNILLFNLIKKNRNEKTGDINIKYDFINKINKNMIKKKKEKLKNNNKKILKFIENSNYLNYKKDIGKTLKRRDKIDKQIKNILENVESKFDKIFLETMGKKYSLSQINEIKKNQKNYIINSNSDIKLQIKKKYNLIKESII